MFEGRSIQQRLRTAKWPSNMDSWLACSFANFMIQGKTKAAIRLITENNRGCILSPDVIVSPETPNSPIVLPCPQIFMKVLMPIASDLLLSMQQVLEVSRGLKPIVGGGCAQHLKHLLMAFVIPCLC